MTKFRALLLTTLLLRLASRLLGQSGKDDFYGQPVACNDGTITFSVARAYRDLKFVSGYEWQVEGWFNVDPGKCKEIGPSKKYRNGGPFRKDSVTLLAFAFSDSTGTWGAIKLGPYGEWQPSNQQFCVQPDGAAYDRASPEGDLPQVCDGAQTGYQMMPASYEYTGPPGFIDGPWFNYDSKKNELHVKLGPSDRAIQLATQGPSQESSSAAAAKPPEASVGMQLLKALAKAAADERQKEDEAAASAAAERQRQGRAAEARRQAQLAVATPPPTVAPSSAPAGPPADDPIGGGGFITPPATFNALMCLPEDLGRKSSWKPGSKMAAFQDMAARYIASVAKPGWQYWISEAQYERFDPTTSSSGDQFVSAVSPDSGRFDEFDPKCPSGYEGFLILVSH